MARRRRSSRQSYAQTVAGFATIGMPTPVRKVATSRLGSKLLLVLVPVLIATGVITISFAGGFPSITFNRDKAIVLGREVGEEAARAAERIRQGSTNPGYR